MKKTSYYIIALTAVVLSVMNIAIWQKEQILSGGEAVYLKLAPLDPRSLMQGDYMRLRYAVDNQIPRDSDSSSNKMVVKISERGIADFVRLDDGTALKDGEKRLKINNKSFRYGIKPNTFLFQEGHAKQYETAEYGIFTFAKNNPDSYLLTGLADKDLQSLFFSKISVTSQ